MTEKKDIEGKYLYLKDNTSARERSGKNVPDNIVMKVGGKEIEVGLFTNSSVYSSTKARLDGAEGKTIKVSVYVKGKYLSLNDHEEIAFVGEEAGSVPEDVSTEEAVDAGVMEKTTYVNMSKVSYRNYLVEEFHKAYQDAALLVEELRKNNVQMFSDSQATMDIACALFNKLAVSEKEYKK
jgi:hypothetical protein